MPANEVGAPSKALGRDQGQRARAISPAALSAIAAACGGLVLAAQFNEFWLLSRAALVVSVLALPFLGTFQKRETVLVAGALVLGVLFLINGLSHGEFYPAGFVQISVIALALLLARTFEAHPRTFALVLAAVSIGLCMQFLGRAFLLGVETNDLIISSRNYVASIVLGAWAFALVASLCGCSRAEARLCSLITSSLAAVTLVFLSGRVGVVLGLCVGVLGVRYAFEASWLVCLVLLSILLAAVLGFDVGGEKGADARLTPVGVQRLQRAGGEDSRWRLWEAALSEASRAEHWTGFSRDLSEDIAGTGWSWHSGYVLTFALQGFVGLLIVVAGILYMGVRASRLDFGFGLIVALFAFRAAFDIVLYSFMVGTPLVFVWLVAERRTSGS